MIKFEQKYLDNDFIEIYKVGGKHFLREIGKNVFYGKILNDDFCSLLLEKVKSYELLEDKKFSHHANSMHSSAILLEDLGLSEFIYDFVNEILINVIHAMFPERMSQEFDGIHSYVVRYGNTRDKNLDFHVDDSLVTMNLCLNEQFIGSELVFNGVRCPIHIDSPYQDTEKIIVNHQKGFAVLHDGKNRHYVNSILDGTRYGLIVWCQNSKERNDWFESLQKSECTVFCDLKK